MKNAYFETEVVTKRITRIKGIAEELMYLVEGTEKAALIDTGVGLGNLKEFVEQLTDKPVIVLLTHGHVDHALGAGLFDTVYMSPLDEAVYLENKERKHRNRFFDVAVKNWKERIPTEEYIEKLVDKFLPLIDGQKFDLGGITVEALALPGHTPGSMVFLFEEERALLFGDACNSLTYLFDHNSSYVSEFQANLEALNPKIEGRYDYAYLSHGTGEVSINLIDSALELIQDIYAGNIDDVPLGLWDSEAYIAKATNEAYERLDGGVANIVYSKQKIVKNDRVGVQNERINKES